MEYQEIEALIALKESKNLEFKELTDRSIRPFDGNFMCLS